MCHSQIDVGAGNMSGKINGAVSHLCLSKASKNLQFFDMINTIQFLGFSIKFSPNRQGKLEPQFHWWIAQKKLKSKVTLMWETLRWKTHNFLEYFELIRVKDPLPRVDST